MYKLFFTLFAIFFCSAIFAQQDSLYAEFQIRTFIYEGEQFELKKPKVLILKRTGCSEIISLGYINEKEIGLQFEILKSSLGKGLLVMGTAFFLRKNGDWELGNVLNYQDKNFKRISDWSQLNEQDFDFGTFSVNKTAGEFQIAYRERYYVLK